MAFAIDDDGDMDHDQDEEGSDYEDPYGDVDGEAEADGEGESQMDEADEEDDDEEEGDGDGDDDDDEDDDDEEDDDEEEDDEDDEAMDVDDAEDQRQGSYDRSLSPTTYLAKVEARRAAFIPSKALVDANAYSIEPVAALPHASHAHAMCLSGDGTVLLTGGSDGHVRRYDVYATMNGKSMLTMGARHGFVEGITKGGVLVSWWANEEHPAVKAEDDSFDERLVSPVHSLAIQQDALWSLSGTGSGNINLSTVRHDCGTTHHILRKHKGPVSALALTNGDAELVSGGWDTGVHQWDLNTGQVVRSYPGHAGQISSLSFRPINRGGESSSRRASPAVSISLSGAKAASSPKADAGNSGEAEPVRSPKSGSSKGRSRSRSANADDTMTTPRKKTPPLIASEEAGPDSTEAEEKVSLEDIQMGDGVGPLPPSLLSLREEPTATGTPSAGLKTDLDEVGGSFTPSADDLAFEQELQKSLALDGLSESNKVPSDNQGRDSRGRSTSETGKPSKGGIGGVDGNGDNDNDSLFGGGSDQDGDVDADGEEEEEEEEGDDDADAEGEEDDDDDDDDDDDQPLSRIARPSGGGDTNGISSSGFGGAAAAGISLPGLNGNGNDFSSTATLPLPQPGTNKASSSTTDTKKGSSPPRKLKTPAWGGLTTTEGYDADTSHFSNDLLLSTTLGGQAILWDRRVPTTTSNSSGGIRALPLPTNTPPWCASATWAPDGERIYIGRRNESVEEWDMRMISSSTKDYNGDNGNGSKSSFSSSTRPTLSSTWSGRRGDVGLVRSFRFPSGSGPVTSLAMMPNGRHLVCASFDNIRLWNLSLSPSSSSSSSHHNPSSSSSSSSHIPFRIVPGHQGGTVSCLLLDPTGKFLFSASGDRAWRSKCTEIVLGHEVRASG